jgi:hypothetical protein
VTPLQQAFIEDLEMVLQEHGITLVVEGDNPTLARVEFRFSDSESIDIFDVSDALKALHHIPPEPDGEPI